MYEDAVAPEFPVEPDTLVFDLENQRQVMFLKGHVTLPEGALIELFDPTIMAYGSATVKRVRLLSATPQTGAQICLDCEVEARWWAKQDEAKGE